jgi:hypothetical protein
VEKAGSGACKANTGTQNHGKPARSRSHTRLGVTPRRAASRDAQTGIAIKDRKALVSPETSLVFGTIDESCRLSASA